MLKPLIFALRMLNKDLLRGKWVIVILALVIATTCITGLRFYTERLQQGLITQSAKMLGGDLVISRSVSIPENWLTKANSLNLKASIVWLYQSVVTTQQKTQLVNVQAIDKHYPVVSERTIHLSPQTMWVEPRLLPLLNMHINSEIKLGAASFIIRQIIPSDIDMMNTGWVIAPRIMVRLDDIPATQTVIPGSRVNYRLLLAGSNENIQQFIEWIKPQLSAGDQLLTVSNQQFILSATLERAQTYLQLILLICLLMSGIVIAISTRQYLRQHYDTVALWRCLGAKRNHLIFIFCCQLFLIGLFAGLIGSVLGYFFQATIADLFNDYLNFPLPSINSIRPILLGLTTSLFLLFAYAFPVISELPAIPPLYIWRKETLPQSNFTLYTILIVISLCLYIYWLMQFSLLAIFFIDITLLSIGALYAISLLVLAILRKTIVLFNGVFKRGLNQLVQHANSTSIQLTAFTLILMSIFILHDVRNQLFAYWQAPMAKTAPNYFAFNIAPDDVPNLKEMFARNHIAVENIYPMVRGRMIQLNDQPIFEMVPPTARQHNALHRELNISSMLIYPSDNKIIAGNKWTEKSIGQALISVASNLSDELNLRLGDKITFQIGDQRVSGVIDNIRGLEWNSFHPNFYVIFPPHVLDSFQQTYITSFRANNQQTNFLNVLLNQFPNVTIIDISDLLKQVQAILTKITLALQYLFGFIVLLAGLVFLVSLQAGMDERNNTYKLLRVLGASRYYIYKSTMVEFGLLILLTILLSLLLSKIISVLLLKFIFNI